MEAKQAQIEQMKDYAAQCQSFFEDVLCDLLLEQPADPHGFMTRKLAEFPKELKMDVIRRVQKLQAQSTYQPFEPNLRKDTTLQLKTDVEDTLRLVLASQAHKEAAFAVLAELKADALDTGNCAAFSAFYDDATLEVLVTQSWRSQNDLESFVQSPAFQRFKSKWAGLLASQPQSKLYSRRVL